MRHRSGPSDRSFGTLEFKETETEGHPLTSTFVHHMGRVLTAAACVGAATMGVYMITYLPTFAQKNLGLPPWSGYAGAVVAGFVIFVGSPLSGALADRVGQTRIMLAAAGTGVVIAFALVAPTGARPGARLRARRA